MLAAGIIITASAYHYISSIQDNEFQDKNNIQSAAAVDKTGSNPQQGNKYETIDTSPSLTKIYKSISELKDDSDIIIEGTVKDTTSVMQGPVPFTISQVHVDEVYMSNDPDIVRGGEAHIIETGGIINPDFQIKEFLEKFPGKPIDSGKVKPKEMTMDGISVLKPYNHAILFAKRYTGKATQEKAYVILGVYQGKFLVEDGKVIHDIPDKVKVKFKDEFKSKSDLIKLMLLQGST
jgi:hypothetical protein